MKYTLHQKMVYLYLMNYNKRLYLSIVMVVTVIV
nr:MAG TPA: hypothetical protein [Crassvirales sp.]